MDHDLPHALEYNYIDDGIFIGTNQCCKTHFDEKLLSEGITADISLETAKMDHPFGVEFYTWIPVENHKPPLRSQLTYGVACLMEIVRQHKKVYVHCQNGHGRAPTLVAAYFIKTKYLSVIDALELIKARRSTIHLDLEQVNALNDYFKSLND